MVGIGLNVERHGVSGRAGRPRDVPPPCGGQPERSNDRAGLLAELLAAFEPLYDDFEQRGPAAAVAAFSEYAALPERCRVDDRAARVSRWASIPTGPCVCATMRARSTA